MPQIVLQEIAFYICGQKPKMKDLSKKEYRENMFSLIEQSKISGATKKELQST
ncbi:MAG: hypothetical protein K8R37_03925 [Bacteroidales bacterium]|nr:hypothetical protein [Bacteroidales bacterium]